MASDFKELTVIKEVGHLRMIVKVLEISHTNGVIFTPAYIR